jgi:hypothetical protein
MDNIITNNSSYGIQHTGRANSKITGNVIDNNGADGIQYTSGLTYKTHTIRNNQITNNTGYGFEHTTLAESALVAAGYMVENNNTFGNSLGHSSPTGFADTGNPKLDPGYTDAASGDYSVDSGMASLGWPDTAIAGTATRSYVDIGPQRAVEAAAGQTLHPLAYTGRH